jgi:hypothetical protein
MRAGRYWMRLSRFFMTAAAGPRRGRRGCSGWPSWPPRRLQPHLLPPGPPSGGQATTIRIPHAFAIAPPAAPVTTTPYKTVTYCDNPDNSISVVREHVGGKPGS